MHGNETDVFQKFMNKDGKLQSELSRDIRGLMGLYEASQLSMEGEDILDRAGEDSAKLLNMWMPNLDHHQARIVGNTLRHPHHKSLPRIMAKDYIRDHKFQNRWVNILLEAAEMEFDFVSTMQREEISQVSKWWKDTGLAKELKFARDQPLKWYMWPAAALTDPSLSEERIDLTKIISYIYIIDDIYDVVGTLDELTLFTEAVNRWDLAAIERPPDYMSFCFKALDNITNEISCKIYQKHGLNPVDSLRKTWADICDAFLVEAKWFASGQLPQAAEYLTNAVISSGAHIVLVHMFFLLGHGLNKESIHLVNNSPSIITSVATMLRLWDDLGSAKDENQDGNDGSFVECYMKDTGCSTESARKQVSEMISNSWKRLNKETLSPTPFSATFRKGCLNLARMIPLMYTYDENCSLPILEKHMKSILHDSTAY